MTVDAVHAQALEKRYGEFFALRGVELAVPACEAFGLIGANGAGKTTLIRCILDLTARDRGDIRIFGADARDPAARRRLVYLPERFVPPHYLRGREFLRTMLALGGATWSDERATRLIEELELDAAALERPVRQLSKGMTQKLGLAAAFLLERDLYVLDEPMSGLDPAARVAVKAVLRRLHAEGRTLFFTSHVLADVEELCSSIAVIERGAVRFFGSPAGLCVRYEEARLEQAFMKCVRSTEGAGAHA